MMMMIINIMTLLSATLLAGSAIFYSVTGLMAIFAASPLSIAIIGTILELSKFATILWLHHFWDIATWWLKTYLIIAVLILMALTSVGIFGGLSKSHIQQFADSQDQSARISAIDEHIKLSAGKMNRWRTELTGLINGDNIRVDTVLSREQDDLKTLLQRLDKEKAGVNKSANGYITLQTNRIEQAQSRKDSAISALGSKPNRSAVSRLQSQELSVASRAQKEILKIQKETTILLQGVESKYTDQINSLRIRISKLKDNSANNTGDVEVKIVALEDKLVKEQYVLDNLSADKAELNNLSRKLEAEIGPIRYIAAFVYGPETSQTILEDAVRWVIVLIIIVFDPLAVLLLIATQYSFSVRKKELALKKLVHEEVVEEVDHVMHEVDILPNVREQDIPVMPEVTKPEPKPEPEVTFSETPELMEIEQPSVLDEIKANMDGGWQGSDEIEEDLPQNDSKIKHIELTKISNEYTALNGKLYKNTALHSLYPELNLNFKEEVKFGPGFPGIVSSGELFIRTDKQPTALYRFNGNTWDVTDKNLLELTAYSKEYIALLVSKIASNEYNPELLNIAEKNHIEGSLANTKEI